MGLVLLIIAFIIFVIIISIIARCVIVPTIFYVIDRIMTYILTKMATNINENIAKKSENILLPNPNPQTNYCNCAINPPNPVQDFRNLIIEGNHLINDL